MQWDNEPSNWYKDGDKLVVEIEGETDVWRHTKHEFVQDNAPWYYRTVVGDFTATVRFAGAYETLFDQVGLMIRENAETWCKCGVELFNGQQHASAVVTRGCSDWSVVPLPDAPEWLSIRAERTGATIEVFFSRDGEEWTMFRQATLTDAHSLRVGVMGAAPQGEGFRATFEELFIDNSN